jgi:UDP-N-acetylmuramoyl-L-alanyl-D-glutamate--2,6-diaminopimelate ligase
MVTHRLTGTRISVAGFTNLSRDHLDFHGDLNAYADAKAKLFSPGFARAACFHVDDPVGARLAAEFSGPSVTVGVNNADLVAQDIECTIEGTSAILRTERESLVFETGLVGAFNLENALVAAGMALLAKVPLRKVLAALAVATPAAGRLERVAGTTPSVFVDYAHTPDALRRVLTTLRPMTPGRLVCVFGAGGDRDRGKRPLMGAAASSVADLCVVTSDNPRSEPPTAIIQEILAGVEGPCHTDANRANAIHWAIAHAGPADVVLIAGKGHERHQIIGDQKIPFDDREVAMDCAQPRWFIT